MKLALKIFVFHLGVLAISALLGWYFSPMWFLVAVVFGLNLLQSTFTGVCPVTSIFKALAEEKYTPPKA